MSQRHVILSEAKGLAHINSEILRCAQNDMSYFRKALGPALRIGDTCHVRRGQVSGAADRILW